MSSSVGLPDKIATFVDKNGDTLQNMALLAYLKKGEEAKPFLETVTTAKVSLVIFKVATDTNIVDLRTRYRTKLGRRR